jgi:hypothetical protein
MALDYRTHRQLGEQLQQLTAHPSGPNVHKGACPDGYILDSEGRYGRKGRCISLMQYRQMQGAQSGAANV